jgi:uncharacterized delta-60 repeat protein
MRSVIAKKSTVALTLAVAAWAVTSPASAQVIDWRRLAFRYNSDGTRDTTFNTATSNGGPEKILQTAPNGTGTGFFDVEPFGTSVVLAGNQDNSFLVQRLLSNGRPDTSFGTNGVVTTQMPIFPGAVRGPSQALGLAVDPLGGVVAAGYVVQSNIAQFAVARYLPEGGLNPMFGNNGTIVKEIAAIGHHNIATAVKIRSDKILIAGYTTNSMVFVVRYTSTGQQDTTFGQEHRGFPPDGIARTFPPAGVSFPVANDMAIDSSGRILVGGTAVISGQNVFACWRFTADGKRDTSFSGDGFAYFWPGKTAQALSIAADGSKPLLVGDAGGPGARTIGLLRMTSTGGFDSTFDGDGWKEHNISQSTEESGWEVALSGSNPIVTGFSGDRAFLARYSSSGAVQGVTRTDAVSNTNVEGTTALTIDASGRFVVAGWVGPPM